MEIKSANKQRGIALLVVLLIVSIIMVIAVEMSSRLQLNVARTLNLKANNQAYWYALGAEQYAKKSLSALSSLTANNINLSQPWTEEFQYPVEGGSIKAQLIDMQACFNLNAINSTQNVKPTNQANQNKQSNSTNNNTSVNSNKAQNTNQNKLPSGISAAQDAFHKLLESFIQDSLVTDTIRDSLVDWIDDDSTPTNYGAEDADYESQANPYLAANNLLGHPSEIRLINGIDQAIQLGSLVDLIKVICVLPETNMKINVNTITEENAIVLSALLGTDLNTGASIVDSRPEEGFKDKADFLALPEVQALTLTNEQKDWFEVTTKYFKLNTIAKFQSSQFKLSTIFRLDNGAITIVSREFGGAF